MYHIYCRPEDREQADKYSRPDSVTLESDLVPPGYIYISDEELPSHPNYDQTGSSA